MKKQINWETLYDGSLSKISSDYIESKCYSTNHNFKTIKQDKNEFLSNVKDNFLCELNTSIYHSFYNLQKRLPLLAEHLTLECFNNKLLDKNEFSKIFVDIYSYAKKDSTLFSNQIGSDKLLEIFKYCDRSIVMNEVDTDYFKTLLDKIKIYRGTAGLTNDLAKSGISWTLDRDKAKEFAEYNKDYYKTKSCLIIDGIILKKDVIVYIHDSARYESEVIVNPADIFNHRFDEYNP